MQSKIKILTILCLSGFCLYLNPGCLYLPQGYRNIERLGKSIEEAKLRFIVPGQTTKAEFIEKMGQPYLMMDDSGVMAYYWKMLAAYVPWLLVGYTGMAGGMEEVESQYLLLLSYDDNGVINKHETIRPILEFKTVNERALQWAGKGEFLRKFTPISIPVSKSVVYVFQPINLGRMFKSRKEDPCLKISGVFLDGNLWAELRGGQYTPIVLPPGTHKIGLEPNIKATDKFLHPHRREPEPSITTTIDTLPNQAYFLELSFVDLYTKQIPAFARPSEAEALLKMAKLNRAR